MTSNNNSNLTINNSNGKSTTFNFKFENDLPAKPILNFEYSEGYWENKNIYCLSIYISKDEIKKFKNLDLENYYYFKEKNELWVTVDDHYLFFSNLEQIIIDELNKKTLAFLFWDENKELIKGLTIK